MKIQAESENKIIVQLSHDDMERLDITYEEMDYSNIETRRVIWTLLDEARRTLGRDIDPSGRMLIEAIPAQTGGCTLCFTVLSTEPLVQPRRLLVKRHAQACVYSFAQPDELLDLAARLYTAEISPRSDLYRMEDETYCLILYPDREVPALYALLEEFGCFYGEGPVAAAGVREYGRLIVASTACERLAGKKKRA